MEELHGESSQEQSENERYTTKPGLDQAAAELYNIVESHFDDLGLTEGKRDQWYTSLANRLGASDSSLAKAGLRPGTLDDPV